MLAMWRMSGLADALELVVSELVANGVNASADGDGTPGCMEGHMPVLRLCLLTDGARLVAEVWDQPRAHAQAPIQPASRAGSRRSVPKDCSRWRLARPYKQNPNSEKSKRIPP